MCGRFTLYASPHDIAEFFGLEESLIPDSLRPRYNIAPAQRVLVVRQSPKTGERTLSMLKWGLVPFWADDSAIGNRLTNARAETAATKPSFRSSFKSRRCLIVADGFYEWQKTGGPKQPYYIRLKSEQPFAFAGLWERWDKEGPALETCTILTTEPNALMAPIHDRMPVIMEAKAYDRWLDPEFQNIDKLQSMLRPLAASKMTVYPISTLVNNWRNDVVECLVRVSV